MDLSRKEELSMYSFNTVEQLKEWVVGSDADIGGKNNINLTNLRFLTFEFHFS